MNAKSSIFAIGVETSENAACGVHECNKIQSYTEKKIKIVCFFYLQYFLCIFLLVYNLTFVLTSSRHFRLVQSV